ncbi:hypothetical protein J6590_022285 [Homalodisca vitripennis]|nr:hypothetical protein J6590_022285 [Homalodisca vitripennis]
MTIDCNSSERYTRPAPHAISHTIDAEAWRPVSRGEGLSYLGANMVPRPRARLRQMSRATPLQLPQPLCPPRRYSCTVTCFLPGSTPPFQCGGNGTGSQSVSGSADEWKPGMRGMRS